MKKKIIIILIILALLVSATVVYLNNVVLPTKVKALIIQGIEKKTGKKVTLESLKINIFKGLVLKNLTICEEKDVLVSVEEAYCRFFIWPVFRKQIIIPSINLKSVIVFLERKKGQTVNLQDFFQPKSTILPQEPGKPKQEAKASAGFNLTVYRVSITDATIIFQDDTLPQPFTKNIENINLKLSLSLPDHLKFKFSGQIPGETPVIISGSGEFKIPGQELDADIRIENLLPKDFSGYAQNWGINFGKGSVNSLANGINFGKGSVNSSANIKFKKDILNLSLEVQAKNLDIQKDKILAQLSSDIKGNLEYNFKDKLFQYAGNASITSSRLSGIESAGDIEEINGNLLFNNDGISSDNLTAKVWGIATQAKLNLKDFSNPLLNIHTSSSLPLDLVQALL
ncbi:MAG: AsmA family protein, partial [Candidatus Omnitrophica bacterium]|nr:AsmA family protein [Candidatus Omnitrophota bacterium]